MKAVLLTIAVALPLGALAKLPAPSDEAKAKAAETAAKAAHGAKVQSYQLCKSQDRAVAHYQKSAKSAGKDVKPAPAMAACADPGPFVAVAAAAPSAPAGQAAQAKKP